MADGLEVIYRRYFPLVRAKCARVLGDADEAQDVAQETILRFWKAQVKGDPKGITVWLYRTATRLAIDRLRQRRATVVEDRAQTAPASDRQLDARQMLGLLAREAPRRELEVALLHRVDRLTQVEVGEVTGLSDRTVRRLLQSFDERLARLGPEGRP